MILVAHFVLRTFRGEFSRGELERTPWNTRAIIVCQHQNGSN